MSAPDLFATLEAPLAERVEVARMLSGGRGFAVTFTGPAAEASVRGSVDGYDRRPSRAGEYRTTVEREAYEYSYSQYRRA
jgi:hypothetical protein